MSAFDKIIGYETVKNELYQIIDMFKNKEIYEKMGAKFPKGILIFGEPGMGKSMLANAFVEELNVKTFILRKTKNDTSFLKEIDNAFTQAAKEKLAVILIDDIDKLSESSGESVDDKMFVAIQASIDSVKGNNVIVIATANNYNKLPDSLVRNGRFDRRIELISPTDDDARKIIEHYMKDKSVSLDLNYEDVSKMISYSSCANLETILNESAIYAAYQRKECIDINDIVKAYLRDSLSILDENYECSQEQIDVTSLHEAGHATIAEVIKEGSVGFISVYSTERDYMQGFTHICKDIRRRPENILIALGGKVAVELYYEGRCGSGCQSDLSKATTMLRNGLANSGTFGMGMLDVSNGRYNISETMNSMSEAVVKAEMERYLFIARDILIKNKDLLMKITEKLKAKHTFLYSDMAQIRDSVKITKVAV